MKHLQIYEEYSDSDIDSLLSDLEGVGHAKSIRIVCVLKNVTPQQLTHPSWWIDYPELFAIVNFVDRGTEEGNKRFALEKIKKGEFDQNLEALSPDEAEVMDRKNIQEIGLSSSTLDDFLDKVSDQFTQVIFRQWEEIVEKYLETRSSKEVEDFFETTYWRQNPKNARNAISEVIDPEIRIRVK